MTPVSYFLAVGAFLFTIGLIGFLTRRNLIVLFLCAELMLQGVALNFVAFARHHGNLHGQVFVLFILTVAACEAGLALAMILMLYRQKKSLDVSLWQTLREDSLPATVDTEPFPEQEKEPEFPKLTPAGLEPTRPEEVIHV
jgi:NADH-quinone oxidoreductase subunit K